MTGEAGRVIRSYYLIAGLYTLSASLIWGVNTLFLLDAGLSFFHVFVANAAFSAGTVIFELPTGIVADTLGRRASFLFSTAVLALATLAYLGLAQVGAGVVAFAAASVVLGLGFTFYSGAVEAWLVDALAAAGFEDELDGVFARGQQVTGATMLLGTIGGGLLGQLDLALPFLGRSVLLVLAFMVAYALMHDRGFTPTPVALRRVPSETRRAARAGIAAAWAPRPLRLLILAAIIQAAFMSWAFYAWQPYLLDLLGQDLVWVSGLISAGVAVSTIVGNQIVRIVGRRCGRRTTLLLIAAATQTVAAVVMGATTSFWIALPALLLLTGALGLAGPVRQAFVHRLVASDQRATVVSFDSMLSGVGSTSGQLGLGALGQATSVGTAYVIGGAATILALPFLAATRSLRSPADQVVGRHAGVVAASCAAQGLPDIASVEPQAVEATA